MSSSDVSYREPDFQPARSAKKRRNRQNQLKPHELLERTRSELGADTQWTELCQLLITENIGDALPEEILCLGLGSPSVSRDARAQLVFLQMLCDDLRIPIQKTTVYDPVFAPEDKDLLKTRLGFNIKDDDHALKAPTIAFMPHCDITLYESFLRANWSPDRLARVVLIGNNLTDYTDSVTLRKLSEECPCILRLAPYLESRSVPISPSHPNAFNNIAVQRVRITDLAPIGDPFWKDFHEPKV